MSSLNGTITLVQVNNVSLVVSQKLHFDVLWLVEEAFHKDSSVAKGGLGFGGSSVESIFQTGLFSYNSHTASTTAIGSLDDNGEPVLVSELLDILELVHCSLSSRDDWYACLDGYGSGGNLVAKGIDNFWRGTDELSTSY
jgi:hypothetical protein